MGINAGFLDRANEVTKANASAFSGSGSDIWKLTLDEETPFDVVMLSEHTFLSQVHFFRGAPANLCNLMYHDSGDPDKHCDDCEKPGFNGQGNNRPSKVLLSIGYVLNLVGAKGKSKKSGKEFSHNPIKIIEVTSGKKEVNFEDMNEAIASDYFRWNSKEPNVWRLKRLAAGGMQKPVILSTQELKKIPVKADVPEEVLKRFSSMPKEEVLGYLLSPYGNLKKDVLESFGIVFPKKVEEVSDLSDSLDD